MHSWEKSLRETIGAIPEKVDIKRIIRVERDNDDDNTAEKVQRKL